MSIPKISIIGRPNVGKSSLLNRMVRRRVSIVDPTPGVTRDRVSALLEIEPPAHADAGTESILVELVDTGGQGVYVAEGRRFDDIGEDLASLTPDIEEQIRIARRQSALVLFVVDAQAGCTAIEDMIARMLHAEGSASRVVMVANKVDGPSWEANGLEAASFGFGTPACVSASNGNGVRALLATLYESLHDSSDEADARALDPEMKIAIVGKRNCGKSTLVNAIAGESRVIVSEIAGTTRDSIDVRIQSGERSLLLMDTAGVRKRKSFADDIEFYAYRRMLAAVRRADVVLLMVDATSDVSRVDKKLAQELAQQFKPTIIVLNKWDLVDHDAVTPEGYLQYITEQLRGFDFAPIACISAMENQGIDDLIAMAFNLHAQAGYRESTGVLNRVIESIMKQRGPTSRLGRQAKLFYTSQVDVYPPTIVMKVNRPELFEGTYERYLLNRLHEELSFSEVPIRLVFSRRSRMSMEELKSRGRARSAQETMEETGDENSSPETVGDEA